jgi:isoamylase
MYLNGNGIAGTDSVGNAVVDDHFLLYFNAGQEACEVTLPPAEFAEQWDVLIDTAAAATDLDAQAAGGTMTMAAGSMLVLREHHERQSDPDHSVAASMAAAAEQATERRTAS